MKFLLDTCVLSELRKAAADPGLVRWAAETDEKWLHLSVVTLMEIQKGITKLPKGPKQAALQAWLERDLLARFSGRVLTVDLETALTWGTLLGEAERQGSPAPVMDALIAATAVAHNLTLVTRNTDDFKQHLVRLLNPWSSESGPSATPNR